MTVEASFIVPLMFFVLIIIIYWSFYTYNNCVIYQDCYIASLRGSQLIDMQDSEVAAKVEEYAKGLLDNQLFQYQKNPKVDIGGFNISISAESSIDNLISAYFNQDNQLNINREAKSKRINPVDMIRILY